MNVRKTRFTNKRLVTSWVTINQIRRQWWIFMHFKPFFVSKKRTSIEENDQQNNNNNKNSCFPSFWQQKENKGKLQFLIVSFRLFFVAYFDCFLLCCCCCFFLFKLQLFWPFTWMIAVAITSGYGGKAQGKKEGETDIERERGRCMLLISIHRTNSEKLLRPKQQLQIGNCRHWSSNNGFLWPFQWMMVRHWAIRLFDRLDG